MADPAAPASTLNMYAFKKREILSTAMKRTSEWIFSQEIPSDVVVHAGAASFPLHKFPLVSKSGHIRRLVSESADADLAVIKLPDVPGGEAAFELAAKFCYGINFEISTENIAELRCVAEHLEMTEDFSDGNLVGLAEAYLTEVALRTVSGAVAVLHHSESLLPAAEEVRLVARCVDAVAYIACTEALPDWWAEDLTLLRIDFFQRALIAMMARGFKQHALGPILMLYAQKSLRGLETRKKMEARQEHEKRVVLETIVGLLPREKNSTSVSFLSMLLRAAVRLDTTVACRLDLEKRMGMQLAQAALDDLFIPSHSLTGGTLFDVDAVQRIMANFVEHSALGRDSSLVSDMNRVARLMETYLAEIASDHNVSVPTFIGLAERVPEHSRVIEDGMYRAIDIYLKAHPAISDVERKRVCSLMDCQKLSREACAHAAQNDRLPIQTVVQVLYFEQQRIRGATARNSSVAGESLSPPPMGKASCAGADADPLVSHELLTLRHENDDLKLEVAKLKMRVKELENSSLKVQASSPAKNISPSAASNSKPPLPRKSIINAMSKKLGRLSPFTGSGNAKVRAKPSKERRHSVS